jgi:hypothetical protein
MQGIGLEPVIHDMHNYPTNWLEQAIAMVISATFWDEDSDYPSELDGDLALAPNCLDKGTPLVASGGMFRA